MMQAEIQIKGIKVVYKGDVGNANLTEEKRCLRFRTEMGEVIGNLDREKSRFTERSNKTRGMREGELERGWRRESITTKNNGQARLTECHGTPIDIVYRKCRQ